MIGSRKTREEERDGVIRPDADYSLERVGEVVADAHVILNDQEMCAVRRIGERLLVSVKRVRRLRGVQRDLYWQRRQ